MNASGRTLTTAELSVAAEGTEAPVIVESRAGRRSRVVSGRLDSFGHLVLQVERDDFDDDPEAA